MELLGTLLVLQSQASEKLIREKLKEAENGRVYDR
jgi:hypothetical protein